MKNFTALVSFFLLLWVNPLIAQEVDVTLADTSAQDNLVPVGLGLSKTRNTFDYSEQQVKGDDISWNTNANFVNSLAGRIAGAQITSSSGVAGSSAYITLRGPHSMLGNSQPLFVLDGLPIDNSRALGFNGSEDDLYGVERDNRIIDINPFDIESITVLNPGAASAMYGMRASNGAIIITTRKGKPNDDHKLNISLKQVFSWDVISRRPEMQQAYGQGKGGQWISGASTTWGPRLDTMGYTKDTVVWNTWAGYDSDGNLVGKNDPLYDPGLDPFKTYNMYDIFRNGFTSGTNLAVSGAGDQGDFYASAGFFGQNGYLPNNTFNRWNFSFGGKAILSKRVDITGHVMYIESGGERLQQGPSASGVMLGLLRTSPTFDNGAGYIFPDGSQRNYRHGTGFDNPYWSVNENEYVDKTRRVIGSLRFNYCPLDWLRLSWLIGTDVYGRKAKDHLAIGSAQFPGGRVYEDQSQMSFLNSDLMAILHHGFAHDLDGSLVLGWNLAGRYSSGTTTTGLGLLVPGIYTFQNANAIITDERSTNVHQAGLYFDGTLAWRNMVILDITGRNDWTTRFPQGNNSQFYPSFSLGFAFTELAPMKDIKFLSFGKVYASWARTGNDNTPYHNTTYYVRANPGDQWTGSNGLKFPLMGYEGYSLGDLMPNSSLRPETSKSSEVGIVLEFLESRAGIQANYFNIYNEDLIIPIPVPASTGYTSTYINSGTIKTTGWELMANAVPLRTELITWGISLNFTKMKDRVGALPEQNDLITLGGFDELQIMVAGGERYRGIYGYDWERNENGKVIIRDDPDSPGYGFPSSDFSKLVRLGSVDPDWTMGISSDINILDQFKVSVLFDIKKGGRMWNGTRGGMYYFGTHGDQVSREPDDYYIFEGVKASDGSPNNIKVIRGENWYYDGEGSGFNGPASPYVENSGWVRMRELTVAYDLGEKVMGKNNFIDRLTIFFTGKNLWMTTRYTGIDPETSLLGSSAAQGLDYYNMPGTRTYIVGVKADF